MNTVELAAIIAVTKREVENRIAENGAVKGDQGLQGIQGPQGPKGMQGDRGPQGDVGPQGVAGPQGIQGNTGPRGADGATGSQGVAGRDGKDGATPAPAVSVRDVYVDPDDGDLYVELTNSRLINAGHVKGKDGNPGKDGRSGVMVGGGGGSSGGASLPPGGTTGQALAKASNADGDVSWQTFSGGGGATAWGTITGTLSAQTDLQTALNGKATTAQGALADTALQAASIGVSVQAYSAVLAGTTASYTTAEQSKLAGIAAGATANSSDAFLLARANHTGVQSVATITGLGSLATQSGTFSGTSSGTNTGDQTSIAGITGTKAQFDTAVTDGNFMYIGDAPTAHTHVAANITDFDTAVAANVAVAANTSKVTNATHTGDATGATALTLATVNTNIGSFGSTSSVATFTVNAKGLTTAAGSTAIQITESQVTNLVTDLAAKSPIASPTFTGTVTLPAGQVVNGVTLTNAGGTTNFLRADGTYAAPSVGGGGATGGTATINFGAAPGTNIASVVVTGQSSIGASSRIKVWFQGGSTADFNEYEHLFILPGSVSLIAGTIVNGVGFTIYATTQLRIKGNVACRWEWI